MNTKKLLKKWEKELGPMTFGKTIKSWRECEEKSLSDFARKLGISKTSLHELETGKRIPTPQRASKVAKKLGLPES